MNTPRDIRDRHFDDALRTRWQLAARRLPAEVAWRLQPAVVATRASAGPGAGDPGPRFWLAGALVAVFALAIGLRLHAPLPSPASTAAASPAVPEGIVPEGVVALDEDPTFYAWLGSDEARAMSLE